MHAQQMLTDADIWMLAYDKQLFISRKSQICWRIIAQLQTLKPPFEHLFFSFAPCTLEVWVRSAVS
jgi:hypothetical protein